MGKPKITVVGIGPGSPEDITPAVLQAVKEADVVVGYKYYFQFIQQYVREGCPCIDTGMKRERDRALQAFELAEQGKNVVVISSGDAGIYGMAPLIYEMAKERKEGRGKATGRRAELGNERRVERDMLGPSMIACVDADYDYLIKGATETSRKVCESPYVLHTYAYSIENLQCYAPSLHNVAVMVTLNDHRIFDFEEWLSLYSEAIFPLFVWSIWHYRRPIYGNFTITDFNRTIELGGFTLSNPLGAIQNIRNKVFKKVGWLQRQYPDAKESYLALKRELLEELGVTPQTTYLYIQGHHLFDKVVVPVMQKVCTKLVRDREQEIRYQSRHSTQMHNELSCYNHSTQDIVQMLKKNMGYVQCDAFRRIQQDTERLLNVSFEKLDGSADAERLSSGGDE